jgi:hypothetical protein
MYKAAYSQDGNIIFYLDSAGNKYAAIGGSLAWRLNNPGLIHSASRFFSRQGSIGYFAHYAIFAISENGREALTNWLHIEKYFKGSLKTIAKHYQPDNADLLLLQERATLIPTIMQVSLTMYVFWDHPSYRLLLSNAIMLIKKD